MKVGEGGAGLEKKVSWYVFTPSKVALPETASRTFSSSSVQELVRVLSGAVLSLLKPLRKCVVQGSKWCRRTEESEDGFREMRRTVATTLRLKTRLLLVVRLANIALV